MDLFQSLILSIIEGVTEFLPVSSTGRLVLYKIVKQFLLGNSLVVVASLLVGGILLIWLEKIHKEKDSDVGKIENLSSKQSFMIGLAQSISIIPGVSRAAATILGGMFLG